MTIPTGPGTSAHREAGTTGAPVEYRLLRNSVVREVRRGQTARVDVCDAHPELLRAARNVGVRTEETCPICEKERTVHVTFVFGPGLPPGGRCPGTKTELRRLCRRPQPVVCYVVEACPGCAWHHLLRKYPSGGKTSGRATERA